jgi:hypothetical protein
MANGLHGENLAQSETLCTWRSSLRDRTNPREEPGALAAHAGICGGRGEILVPTATPHHAEPFEIFSSARRKRLQQPSHSLLTPSAILISIRSRSVPEHCAQDANEQQRCDWPMKPDSVQTGEDID